MIRVYDYERKGEKKNGENVSKKKHSGRFNNNL